VRPHTDPCSGYNEDVANSSDLVAVMAELHAALTPGDLTQTLSRVTDAAVELLPDVDGATITVERGDHHFETAAATGTVDAGPELSGGVLSAGTELAADTAARLDRLQQTLEEGPAVDVVDSSRPIGAVPGGREDSQGPSAGDALHSDGRRVGEPETLGDDQWEPADTGNLEPGQAPAVTTSDLSSDERYPTYGVAAVSSGVRAQVAVLLFDTARARGVLNLYSHRPGAFADMAVLTDLFAHHSATALAYAVENDQRETAAAERRTVGQALGIVMERFNLTEATAFALLQQTAQRRTVSVRLVAQELVASAEEAGTHD
jgi:hypothetical protein